MCSSASSSGKGASKTKRSHSNLKLTTVEGDGSRNAECNRSGKIEFIVTRMWFAHCRGFTKRRDEGTDEDGEQLQRSMLPTG